MMTRNEAERILQQQFGLNHFYDRQWETIQSLMNGERVLLIEKTGFGKSLCFQFPATLFSGTTIVFSPLIALMRDQVKAMNRLGVPARCINCEQTPEENSNAIRDAQEGKVKILYIAPERQENNEWIEATRQMRLSMVVIDEAHCISVWGHDFRPAFRRIITLVNLLPVNLPVLATTATATRRVERDIASQMGQKIKVLRGNLMRENFKLFVARANSEDEKMVWLARNLEKLPGTGILYTGTRIATDLYVHWLQRNNISCINYNAGLEADTRIEIEDGLMKNRWKCVVSTNALGMGIDKPDIRFIVHTQIPQSPVHYYQEIGRAGRDGKPAYIILFYNPADRQLPDAFIEGGRPAVAKYERVIAAIRNELLGEKELMKQTNLKQTQIRVIKSDLIEQGIIREVTIGRSKKLEYIRNSLPLNSHAFQELRNAKKSDLESMIQYAETDQSRMKFLCEFLGDTTTANFNNCDNSGLQKIHIDFSSEWQQKIDEFHENYFPVLEIGTSKTALVDGIAASYYGISRVGNALHHSKYENGGDFPDFLLQLTLKAFRKKFRDERVDLILYVPPTVSGNLVQNFAVKIGRSLNVPVSHDLVKIRQTKEQKIFENSYLKGDNVRDAFQNNSLQNLTGKTILLIDDIYDSGATIKEIGRMLTHLGAGKIIPLVIAKTVGGDTL